MRRAMQDYTYRQRIMAAMIALVVVCLLVFSSVFLAKESGHDCSGQDCPVCAEMQACSAVIRRLGSAAVPVLLAILVFSFWLTAEIYRPVFTPLLLTLVSLKIRLND